MDSTFRALENALAAARGEAWRRALDHLLVAWRTAPVPEILAAFHAVEARVRVYQIVGASPRDHDRAWFAAVPTADAAQLCALCASIDTVSSRSRLRQYEVLREHPHPTFFARIERELAAGSPDANSWGRLVTPRQRALWTLVQAIAGDIAAQPKPPSGAAQSSLCRQLEQLARTPTTTSARFDAATTRLVELVRETRGSRASWLALADHLQQDGDPRGERIILELEAATGRWMKRERSRRLQALRIVSLADLPRIAIRAWPEPIAFHVRAAVSPAELARLLDAEPAANIVDARVPIAFIPEVVAAVAPRLHLQKIVLRTLARTSGPVLTFRRSRAGELSSLTIQIQTGGSFLVSQPIIDLLEAFPADQLQYLRITQAEGQIPEGFRTVAMRQSRLRRLLGNGVPL